MRFPYSVAILACTSGCWELFTAMAAPVTWDMITAMAAQCSTQPKHRHNESLKHHRDLAETPAGVPNGIAINIRLADAVTMIRKVLHGPGQQFTFSQDELVP